MKVWGLASLLAGAACAACAACAPTAAVTPAHWVAAPARADMPGVINVDPSETISIETAAPVAIGEISGESDAITVWRKVVPQGGRAVVHVGPSTRRIVVPRGQTAYRLVTPRTPDAVAETSRALSRWADATLPAAQLPAQLARWADAIRTVDARLANVSAERGTRAVRRMLAARIHRAVYRHDSTVVEDDLLLDGARTTATSSLPIEVTGPAELVASVSASGPLSLTLEEDGRAVVTSRAQAASIFVPPGRHVYRLTTTAPALATVHRFAPVRHLFGGFSEERELLTALATCADGTANPACELARELARASSSNPDQALEELARDGNVAALEELARRTQSWADEATRKSFVRALRAAATWESQEARLGQGRQESWTVTSQGGLRDPDPACVAGATEIGPVPASVAAEPHRGGWFVRLLVEADCGVHAPVQIQVDGVTLTAQPASARTLWRVAVTGPQVAVKTLDRAGARVLAPAPGAACRTADHVRNLRHVRVGDAVVSGGITHGLELWLAEHTAGATIELASDTERRTIEIRPTDGLRARDEHGRSFVRVGTLPFPDAPSSRTVVTAVTGEAAMRAMVRRQPAATGTPLAPSEQSPGQGEHSARGFAAVTAPYGLDPDFDASAARCAADEQSPRAQLERLEREHKSSATFNPTRAMLAHSVASKLPDDPRARIALGHALAGSRWRVERRRSVVRPGTPLRFVAEDDTLLRIDVQPHAGNVAMTIEANGREMPLESRGGRILVGARRGSAVLVRATAGAAFVALEVREATGANGAAAAASVEPSGSANVREELPRVSARRDALADRASTPRTAGEAGTLVASTGGAYGNLRDASRDDPSPDGYVQQSLLLRYAFDKVRLFTTAAAFTRQRDGEPTLGGRLALWENAWSLRTRFFAGVDAATQSIAARDVTTLRPRAFVEHVLQVHRDFAVLPRIGYEGYLSNLAQAPASLAGVDADVHSPWRRARPHVGFAQVLGWWTPHVDDAVYLRARASVDGDRGDLATASVRPGGLVVLGPLDVAAHVDALYLRNAFEALASSRLDAVLGGHALLHAPISGRSVFLEPGLAGTVRASDGRFEAFAFVALGLSRERGLRDVGSYESGFFDAFIPSASFRASGHGGPQ